MREPRRRIFVLATSHTNIGDILRRSMSFLNFLEIREYVAKNRGLPTCEFNLVFLRIDCPSDYHFDNASFARSPAFLQDHFSRISVDARNPIFRASSGLS